MSGGDTSPRERNVDDENAQHLAKIMGMMGQELLRPPSVKGWDGGLVWLNSNTLISRFRFAGG